MGVAWRHLSDGPGDRLGSVAGAPGRNIHNKWVIRVTLRRVGCATEREIGDSFTGGAGADWAWWSERSSKPSGARKGLGGFDSHTLPPRPGPAGSPGAGDRPVEMRFFDRAVEREDGGLVEQRCGEARQRPGQERQAVDLQIADGVHGVLEEPVRPRDAACGAVPVLQE